MEMPLLTLAESVSINFNFSSVAALAAGILILIYPKLLNYIVAIYLITIGVLGMIH